MQPAASPSRTNASFQIHAKSDAHAGRARLDLDGDSLAITAYVIPPRRRRRFGRAIGMLLCVGLPLWVVGPVLAEFTHESGFRAADVRDAFTSGVYWFVVAVYLAVFVVLVFRFGAKGTVVTARAPLASVACPDLEGVEGTRRARRAIELRAPFDSRLSRDGVVAVRCVDGDTLHSLVAALSGRLEIVAGDTVAAGEPVGSTAAGGS